MPENIKIGIIGGDRRQLVAAGLLSSDYECAIWGFEKAFGSDDESYIGNAVKCRDWESAVTGSDALILPLPATKNGVDLNCPLQGAPSSGIKLTEICEKMKIRAILLGGMIPGIIKSYATEHGIRCYDYYDSEELQIMNSVPTAEGAIAACINALPVTL